MRRIPQLNHNPTVKRTYKLKCQEKIKKIKELSWQLKKFAEQYEYYAHDNEISIASKKINEILFQNKKIDDSDLQLIKEQIHWTENQIHWNGVSWMDYKMHIRTYLRFKGFKLI